MNNKYFIFLSLFVIIYIIWSIRKGNLSVKTSFGWIFASIVMLILSIFPYSLDWLASLVGIEYPPALFLTLCVVLLIIIDFNYSKKIQKLEDKIVDLTQEVGILKAEIDDEK